MRTYKEFISIVEQWSAQANVRYGSVPAVATDRSISRSVDSALAGNSQSASEIKGKTGLTGSGSISYSRASVSKPSSKPPSKPEPKTTSSSTSHPPIRPIASPVTPSTIRPTPSRPPISSPSPSSSSSPSNVITKGLNSR